MVSDMSKLWVGPMPVEQFLKDFLPPAEEPCPALPSNYFNKMPKVQKESEMYQPFIDLLHMDGNGGLVPNFKMVDTSNHPDKRSSKNTRIKPDPTLYHESVDTSMNVTRFEEVALHFELKPNESSDPFGDPPANMTPEARRTYRTFEASTVKRATCRGQLVSYAREWFSRQHRLFGFTIFLGDPWVRFIRWDRAGAVVSEKFNYREESHHLVQFLWRFTHLDDAGRGLDPTVRRATSTEHSLAVTHLSDWNKTDPGKEVVVMTVMDGGREREFIAWGSMSHAGSLTGRCTRAYPVYEAASNEKFFLKDTWRAYCLEKEATILQELHAHDVEYIPPFICGDDISGHVTFTDLYVPEVVDASEASDPSNSDVPPSSGADITDSHNTLTPDIVLASPPPRPESSWRCGISWERVTQRFHHRFVVQFIGHQLDTFKNSKQMVQAVFDAYTAHQQAYEKCGIIHRDISARNILLDANGRGILNDWDLAKHEKDIKAGGRRHERTGTWEFMSAFLLMNHDKIHTIQDDIESFVHVLLWHGLRFLRHTRDEHPEIIPKIFEDRTIAADGSKLGGEGKRSMFCFNAHIGTSFAFMDVEPLNSLMDYAMAIVKQWIEFHTPPVVPPKRKTKQFSPAVRKPFAPPAPCAQDLDLASHEPLAAVFQEVLSMTEWPTIDKYADLLDQLKTPSFIPDLFSASTRSSQVIQSSQGMSSYQSTGSKRGRESCDIGSQGSSTSSKKRRREVPPMTMTLRSSTGSSSNAYASSLPTPLREIINSEEL